MPSGIFTKVLDSIKLEGRMQPFLKKVDVSEGSPLGEWGCLVSVTSLSWL